MVWQICVAILLCHSLPLPFDHSKSYQECNPSNSSNHPELMPSFRNKIKNLRVSQAVTGKKKRKRKRYGRLHCRFLLFGILNALEWTMIKYKSPSESISKDAAVLLLALKANGVLRAPVNSFGVCNFNSSLQQIIIPSHGNFIVRVPNTRMYLVIICDLFCNLHSEAICCHQPPSLFRYQSLSSSLLFFSLPI